MEIDLAKLRRHVERTRDDADRKAIATAALDRFEELADVVDPADDELEPIVTAATSEYALLWGIGVDLLLALAARSHAGLDAVLRVVTHGRANARMQLITGLDHRVAVDLATELCRFAIDDRSSRVRVRAAEKIAYLELDLVAELRERTSREGHRIARSSLERYLAIATVGYDVEHGDDGRTHVWFRTRTGWSGFDLSAEEMAAGLVPDRLAEARNRRER